MNSTFRRAVDLPLRERASQGSRGPGARIALGAAVVVSSLLALVLTVLAVLVDRQGDILGTQSEAGGGFDPSVFPPYSDAIWVLSNAAALISVVVLIALVALCVGLRLRKSASAGRQMLLGKRGSHEQVSETEVGGTVRRLPMGGYGGTPMRNSVCRAKQDR